MTPEAELKEFLRKPKNDAEPPLPPHLGNLPHATYVTAALEYLDDYPFWVDPNALHHRRWDEKARSYLKACVEVDRTSLASIDPTYDANLVQQRFIHEGLFKHRWALDELASEMIALLKLVRWETRTASAVATPVTTGEGRDDRVADKVRMRDENCRLSGVIRDKNRTDAEALELELSEVPVATMQVAHGLPFAMGETSFCLVEVLTGLPITTWGLTVDCVQNALLMSSALHHLFGSFKLYLEADPNDIDIIYIRGRRSPARANPRSVLFGISNDRGERCSDPFALINTPLRPRAVESIADIDMKYFTLHKFIGDIAWMCGGAEPESDNEGEDGEDMKVLSAENWLILKEKLTCCKDFLAQNDGLL
ncbi:hypothetical protein BDZ89DRAFT_1182156 [Hymenopellis radicata]|nr:hypothetical protein BDZ89DRAFT_1182156 [Hymenopellis radicata]